MFTKFNTGIQMKQTLKDRYQDLVHKSLNNGTVDLDDIYWILESDEVELLPLLQAAYQVRYKHFGNRVKIHILHNVESGGCTEDCKYCAQSKESDSQSESYHMKSDAEILKAAGEAYDGGAYRHCTVFSGRTSGTARLQKICSIVEKIKAEFPMEICVSAGFLTKNDAQKLKEAGVNRYNHNLNTNSDRYGQICTTHPFQQRVDTITTAKDCGLEICSGVIIGMGESAEDIFMMVKELRDVGASSIPVNFFIPVKGHRLSNYQELTPRYCLKTLASFRFAIPQAEIRAAGGREHHLRTLQPLCLYAANSIFAQGYLTTGGDSIDATRRMIEDCGFIIEKIEY